MDHEMSGLNQCQETGFALPRPFPGGTSALGRVAVEPGLQLGALFDEFSFGVAIVGAGGSLIHASRAALMQLQACRGLRLARGVVEAVREHDVPGLRLALEGAVAGRRSYLVLGPTGARLDVAFVPTSIGGPGRQPAAALVFEKCVGSSGLGLYFFSQAYGLTRTEQLVLGELCEGISVVEVAKRKGSAVHTVRTHVRNILMKTEEANLRSLVRRIGLMPPIGARFAIAHARTDALGSSGTPAEVPRAPLTPVSGEVETAVRSGLM
jgi:DNA-binding CsgD family transcriptional regulator